MTMLYFHGTTFDGDRGRIAARRKMMRNLLVALGLVPILYAADASQTLQKAIDLLESKGDVAGAITLFEEATRTNERPVAARALLYLGRAQERQGAERARATYERIARDFGDQREVVTEARRRLTVLNESSTIRSAGLTTRRIQVGGDIDDLGCLSTDGRFMAITHWATGDLGIRDMSSGQIRRLNLKTSWNDSDDFAQGPVFSPDQRQIAYAWYSDKDRFYQMHLISTETGGKPRILVSNPELEYFQPAGWSRDSKAILAGIWLKDRTSQVSWISVVDGSIKALKSMDWRQPRTIALSPDGRYIAYDVLQRQDRPEREIHILASNGTTQNPLVAGPVSNWAPTWSPDGSRIFFLSNQSGQSDLWSISVEDGRPVGRPQIAKADIGAVAPIGFNRAGTLFYVSNRTEQDVLAIEIDHTAGKLRGPARPLSQVFLGRNERPVWSPDNKWVAFHSLRGLSRYGPGAVSLVVRSLDTGEEKAFPAPFAVGQRPAWFHTGSALLEATRDAQGRAAFQKLDLTTGKFELLRPVDTVINSAVSLAADDNTVYATSCDSDVRNCAVTRFDLKSGQQANLYSPSGRSNVTGLTLSPDGKMLAIMLNTRVGEPRTQQLAVIGSDGTGFRILLQSEQQPLVPVVGLGWSPDNRWVYFVKIKEPESELWRVPVNGGVPENTGFTAVGLRHIDISSDGSHLAFTAGRRVNPELWAIDNLLSTARPAK
jgi:Tol biopolymer transport system component